MLLGINLTLLIGPTVALPAPPDIVEAVQSVQVTHNDEGRSGFTITLQVGRSGPLDLLDYPLLLNPLIKPFNRVIMTVLFGGVPSVLMDGIITTTQLTPSSEPGASTLTLTGEDVSVMMDLEKKRTPHPALPEPLVVAKILAQYMKYGLIPTIVPPPVLEVPLPIEKIPVQIGTDLEHVKSLAETFGYVFYIDPGPAPFTNTAYWGPPKRAGIPQGALNVNMGPATNVENMSFTYNGMAPTIVKDEVQEKDFNLKLPVMTFASTRVPPLVPMPALPLQLPNVRTSLLGDGSATSFAAAYAKAQAITDKSMDSVVTASGDLDAFRYGAMLKPRGLVGVRGAGFTNDGFYYVKNVSHSLSRGQYRQRFTLTREGTGALSQVVIP